MAEGQSWETRREQLRDDVESFMPYMSRVPTVHIVLVGSVGAGKSSMVNTVDSALKGRVAGRAEVLNAPTSVTKQFRKYELGGRRKSLGFDIWDTMGMEEDRGLELTDLIYVLDGNVPNGFVFDRVLITPQTRGFVKGYEFHRQMHCVAYVMDATKVRIFSSVTWEKCKRLLKLCQARGLKMFVLLTHIDDLSEKVTQDSGYADSDSLVQSTITTISHETGVPTSDIFAVRNYAADGKTDPATDVLALRALQAMLTSTNELLR